MMTYLLGSENPIALAPLLRSAPWQLAVPGELLTGGQELAVATPIAGALVRGAAAAHAALALDQDEVVADLGELGRGRM